MKLDPVRKRSLKLMRSLSYPTTPPPPPIEKPINLKTEDEIKDRLLALYVLTGVAWGSDRRIGKTWLDREKLWHAITAEERNYLVDDVGLSAQFELRVEAVWALKWALSLLETLDFSVPADNRYRDYMPNPRRRESSFAARRRMHLRPPDELVEMYDLALCLHYPARAAQAAFKEIPGAVKPVVVAERRHALEWIVTASRWEDISVYL
jgi:Domain of unknown function (DUF4272)